MIEAAKMEKHMLKNRLRIEFEALSENESFARVAVAAFIAPLNPTLEELSDVKTAVSEAVTNAIIHGYDYEDTYLPRTVYMFCEIDGDVLTVEVEDKGKGIGNIDIIILNIRNGGFAHLTQIKRTNRACHTRRNTCISINKYRRKCYREKGRFFHCGIIVIHKINCILIYIGK